MIYGVISVIFIRNFTKKTLFRFMVTYYKTDNK